MVAFLESATGDTYNPQTGSFRSGAGQDLFYTSADRIQSDSYRNLDPGAVLHEANRLGLRFNPDRGTGSVFYMLGALPTVGKLGLIAIDETPELADERYDKTISILDQLAARTQIDST